MTGQYFCVYPLGDTEGMRCVPAGKTTLVSLALSERVVLALWAPVRVLACSCKGTQAVVTAVGSQSILCRRRLCPALPACLPVFVCCIYKCTARSNWAKGALKNWYLRVHSSTPWRRASRGAPGEGISC